MKVEVIDRPEPALMDFFEQRIHEFNVARWDIKEKIPLAVKVSSPSGEIIAGAAGKTFGLWLMIDNLWVKEDQRSKSLGSKVLAEMEAAGAARGCKFVLLDTLDFQARPFYEKYGYHLQWAQENYPQHGSKYFMMKVL